jgi:hypothetical protein
MSYSYNSVPIISGAYLVNGGNNTTNELYHLPIFGSISSVNDMGFGNEDNAYYVLPGYKLEIYPNANFGGTLSQTINNTTGTKIMYTNATSLNNCESLKMYYNNVEISNNYTYTLYTDNSGSTTTTPSTTNKNGPYKLNNMPIFPGAYLIDGNNTAPGGFGSLPIFFSVSDLSTYPANETPDSEDSVLVMPGYKLILYENGNYNNPTSGNYVAIDNTMGTTIIVGKSSTFGAGWNNNTASSCKLFYNGNEVLSTDII